MSTLMPILPSILVIFSGLSELAGGINRLLRCAREKSQKITWHRAIETYSPRLLNFLVRYASG